LARVAVILHERLGTWARQLRPRLSDQPVRWFETRSAADLEGVLTGLAYPVVLIDLGRHAATGLMGLDLVARRAPDARILVLDPAAHPEVPELARELGATHVISGFVPPPAIADLIGRWIALARRGLDHAGWSRTTFLETRTDLAVRLPGRAGGPRCDAADRHPARILEAHGKGEG
jgi:DNA-binding NarL/FixJ family response regulator